MKSQTRVVVIGGGIAGCSTLYHLTQEGWSDVVLVERDEPQRGQVLSLQSPVRTLHEERYRIMRTRDLDAPESLARRFIQAGLAARVLGSSNARAL